MTEKKKRFTKCDDGTFCLLDNGKGLEYDEVIDLFNELYEENEQLKHDATVLICSNQEYRKENEQLKQENQELHKLNQEYINNLSDEKKETLSEMLNAILGDDGE